MKKKKIKNRERYNSFADFILNDENIVFKFLITLSKWVQLFFFSALTVLVILFSDFKSIAIILGGISLFSLYGLIKFYKMGGAKHLTGMSTAEMFWNREKIIIDDNKKKRKKRD